MGSRIDVLRDYITPAMLTAVVSYLLGSLNFGIIFTYLFTKKDIRSFGSGNAGATNVLRAVGKLPAALTFLFDFLKCVASVLLGRLFFTVAALQLGAPEIVRAYGAYYAGFFCLLGHIFPVFFKFRGGKGVTTAAAMIAVIDWRIFLCLLVVFAVTFAVKRYVSLSSVCSAVCLPVFTFLITFLFDCSLSPLAGHNDQTLAYVLTATGITLIIGAIVVFMHRANIRRLLNGTEKKMDFKKTK